ncbi:ferrous iron transport protein A [Tissierella pigra]|uniref:Ferrous iron transport protein A n=1 Tax=Tissierella pigra TaxID=2607614 RepID=A0A6N7Y033_9FIRM|nr:FeoA family protein [Tissierella pigra]MBU5424825.1 ferrous iron transport protein A [Tissierella pigra]MSU02224.1 ferrous iron transport protein A [Tissierella pigra]
MSLMMVPLGETKIVTEFRGKDDMKRHLQDLGVVKGEKIQVVGETSSGLILLIKGVRIALNRGLASLIIVN